jgi:hypothetical protein
LQVFLVSDVLEPEPAATVLHPSVQGFAGRKTWTYAATLMQSPDFAEALASYCAAMVQPPGFSWPTDKVFAQKLRYLVAFVLIGNDARWRRSGGELPTLAALQRAAPASARQIAGFVSALRHGGYVIATRDGGDRRALHLRPSMALLQEIARSPLAFLEASERLATPPRPLADRLRTEADSLSDWLGRSYDRFQADDILFAPFPGIVRFTEHDCGYPVLSAVFGARYARLLGIDPPVRLSYTALAERFRVSRQHIGNIFVEAERHGIFAVSHGGRDIWISPAFVQEFETWAAGQMAHYRLLAEEEALVTLNG